MVDYRTFVSGVDAETLKNGITLEEARDELCKVVFADTILVGHSLHYDLATMRLVHWNVIDTSMIFDAPALPGRTFALKVGEGPGHVGRGLGVCCPGEVQWGKGGRRGVRGLAWCGTVVSQASSRRLFSFLFFSRTWSSLCSTQRPSLPAVLTVRAFRPCLAAASPDVSYARASHSLFFSSFPHPCRVSSRQHHGFPVAA